VYKNLSLATLPKYKVGPVVLRARELEAGRRIVEQLDIKITGFHQRTGNLSGENQQKVVVGKWLAAGPRVLIMDEPARGIDVGSAGLRRDLHHLHLLGGPGDPQSLGPGPGHERRPHRGRVRPGSQPGTGAAENIKRRSVMSSGASGRRSGRKAAGFP
jgi:hypothetical protein